MSPPSRFGSCPGIESRPRPVWIPKLYNGRQRTFFFVAFNGIRNQNPSFSPRSLPNSLERSGDFSQSYTTQLINGERVRYPVQIYDPASVDARGYRQQFPGNVIPVSRLNPLRHAFQSFSKRHSCAYRVQPGRID